MIAQQLVTKQSNAAVSGLVLDVHAHQLLRVAIRERTQQQGVGDGEDRGVRADPQGQRDDCGERKDGSLAEHARTETEIPKESLHEQIIGRGIWHGPQALSMGAFELSAQSDNVLFAQSRNVLLTTTRLGRWQKDNY